MAEVWLGSQRNGEGDCDEYQGCGEPNAEVVSMALFSWYDNESHE
jgi:hypothetical protein